MFKRNVAMLIESKNEVREDWGGEDSGKRVKIEWGMKI